TTKNQISIVTILKDLLLVSIFSTFFGLIIGILIALFRVMLSKNISALYDYARDESDKIIRLNHFKAIDADAKINKGLKNINQPLVYNKIVLLDSLTEDDFEEMLSELSSNSSYYTDLSMVQE